MLSLARQNDHRSFTLNGHGWYRRQQLTGGFTTLVDWLGQRVTSRLALSYIHQMNEVNSCNDFVMMTAPQTLSKVLL